MALFRKKPVEVEARSFVSEANAIELAAWCGGEYIPVESPFGSLDVILIRTLEGAMSARKGDWIIQGVQGEFYPCKPDIFVSTYEPVG